MENSNSPTNPIRRWMHIFALSVWSVCFTAALLRILTIHPLNPAGTPYIDAFESLFLAVMLPSCFVYILFFAVPKLPEEAELKRRIPKTFFDSFLTASRILSWICCLRALRQFTFWAAYRRCRMARILSPAEAKSSASFRLSGLPSFPISCRRLFGKGYYDSMGLMWWALLGSSEAACKMHRQYLIQKAASEISTADKYHT